MSHDAGTIERRMPAIAGIVHLPGDLIWHADGLMRIVCVVDGVLIVVPATID